jgi:hypothetical protein
MKRIVEQTIPKLSYEIVEGNFKHLQGQILTLIEAVVPEGRQLDSTKSAIKGYFNDKLTLLFDWYGPDDRETPKYSK